VRRFHSARDARERSRDILPRAVFDFVDGGADDEVTLRRNEEAFAAVELRPRVAVRMGRPSLATTVLGEELSLPILLAPCGFARAVYPNGDICAARAAEAIGTVSILSSASATSLEDVARGAPDAARWFQLYFLGGREGAEQLIDRARTHGYRVLVVTVDTAAVGNHERDIRNRVPQPLKVDVRTMLRHGPNMMRHPRWLLRFLRDGMPLSFANAVGLHADGAVLDPVEAAGMMAQYPPTWDDVAWIRAQWTGPLVVKGVLDGDDAARAIDAGADAVVVSNHGGRQLDGVAATIDVLPDVVQAVSGRAEVLIDSGVRRGADVVKAISLGANAVLVGRPYLWGLACGGQAGVEAMLKVLRTEMLRTLKLLGCASVSELSRGWVRTPLTPSLALRDVL
jgi:isopentenyl diphosphate isomerase/L-lactate dehydrogenase-like FMN-dependent dehydrogenase